MLAAAAIGFTSCNDSFMERYPDTSLTEQTVFSNYNTFKTYAWGLYGVFSNTNILRIPGTNGAYASATSYTKRYLCRLSDASSGVTVIRMLSECIQFVIGQWMGIQFRLSGQCHVGKYR